MQTKITFTVSQTEADRLTRLAELYRCNKTEAFRAALTALEAAHRPVLPTAALAVEVWNRLAGQAERRLRKALTEPELAVCLQATRTWLVTVDDAALIHLEVGDMDPPDLHGRDAMFGAGPDTTAPVDLPALAAKLAAMSDLDRAVLTLACRQWWDAAEPRPPLTAILGGQLRGPRSN